MGSVEDRVLAELPVPLRPDADLLDALAIAIAVEDACGVTIPDEMLDVDHLRRRATIEELLSILRRSG